MEISLRRGYRRERLTRSSWLCNDILDKSLVFDESCELGLEALLMCLHGWGLLVKDENRSEMELTAVTGDVILWEAVHYGLLVIRRICSEILEVSP